MTGPLGQAHRGRRTAAVAVAVVGVALGSVGVPSSAATSTHAATSDPEAAAGTSPGNSTAAPTVHSSDGVTGPLAPRAARNTSSGVVRTPVQKYQVAPGLRFRSWDQEDARGTIRAYLLRANLDKAGLSLEYAGPPKVTARDELTDMLGGNAVAAVNGDFFDITDTGAPLGVGVRRSQVVHGPSQGWLTSFFLSGRGVSSVGRLPVHASVATRPSLGLTNVNSPRVPANGIGVYTERWGTAPGYAVTDGARRRDVRQVLIQRGVVVSNTVGVSVGDDIDGRLLIGRGDGAVRLNRQLPVGTRAPVEVRTHGKPAVAISGSTVLLRRGRVVTDDDGELHPRTAVGVDTDTGNILLLVIDGRQETSRGYTLLELARLLEQLGAEHALNLDGGGSSTMVTRGPTGVRDVASSPSEGEQRQVPNGLQLIYNPR